MWGVLATGYDDPSAQTLIDKFHAEMNAKDCPRDDERYQERVVVLGEQDLSPSYAHLDEKWKDGALQVTYAVAGNVDLEGVGPIRSG